MGHLAGQLRVVLPLFMVFNEGYYKCVLCDLKQPESYKHDRLEK